MSSPLSTHREWAMALFHLEESKIVFNSSLIRFQSKVLSLFTRGS